VLDQTSHGIGIQGHLGAFEGLAEYFHGFGDNAGNGFRVLGLDGSDHEIHLDVFPDFAQEFRESGVSEMLREAYNSGSIQVEFMCEFGSGHKGGFDIRIKQEVCQPGKGF